VSETRAYTSEVPYSCSTLGQILACKYNITLNKVSWGKRPNLLCSSIGDEETSLITLTTEINVIKKIPWQSKTKLEDVDPGN